MVHSLEVIIHPLVFSQKKDICLIELWNVKSLLKDIY